jgi:predicted DsbA family dithiol-disulfide isomerase
VVERLKADYQMEVDWRPFYLYWDTPPEGRELPERVIQARAAGSEERLRQLAASYGMKFVSTKRIYNTRLAHEATEYARDHGRHAEFHAIVFRMIYAEELDISRWDVLREAAIEAGLDSDEMQREVEAGKYAANVEEQVQQAYRMGVSGVPTYVINHRYAVVGAQPYEVFKSALEKLLRSQGGSD